MTAEFSDWRRHLDNPRIFVVEPQAFPEANEDPVVIVPMDIEGNSGSQVRAELASLVANTPPNSGQPIVEINTTPPVHTGPPLRLPRPATIERFRTHRSLPVRPTGWLAVKSAVQAIFY